MSNYSNSLLDSIFNPDENSDNQIIVESPQVINLLNQSKLNWNVDKIKLLTPDNDESGFYATQRSDIKQCFATFTDQYEIFQNIELAKLVSELSNHFGFEMHTGGMFNGGKKVYLQLK